MNNTTKHTRTGKGKIISIDGSVIGVFGLDRPKVGDLVAIGEKKLIGEVIKIYQEKTITQCFDNTEGLRMGEPVENTNKPLSMELGPGLLNQIFDGIQRPLTDIDDFLETGISIKPLSRKKIWHFIPLKKRGDHVKGGDIIGEVQETSTIVHKIMVPFNRRGIIADISEGDYRVNDDVYTLEHDRKKTSYSMIQKWPIRQPRPFKEHYYPKDPLITGMRVIDLMYPVAKGGAVAIPGGFGTGKTVTQHSLAKFANADIIFYVGCGERGNEMADVLEQFPGIIDPHTEKPIMERTVLIANTSNMPVSAREASIFSGLTMAEYYRDMGYDVCLLADSTSRWAEALREISARLEEMPTEGGYPAYLATRLANFYERAGLTQTIGNPTRKGSLTLIGAVSPQGGDFSEPVTKTTRRFVRTFWALDPDLAYSRHYPAISWTESYSLYAEILKDWWKNNFGKGWNAYRNQINAILSESDELQNMVQLVGRENLPSRQQLDLFTSDLIKDAFLIQNAFDPVDQYSSPEKTLALIRLIIEFYSMAQNIIEDIPMSRIKELSSIEEISRAKSNIDNDHIDKIKSIESLIEGEFDALVEEYNIHDESQEK
ncbi:MAG: V-type ATP synthase subunit A [Candidatus Lokiarchaeota archaeon]|nr:V-type ATP synthase subunit A [Candidatus Lokiarchaeota archaeon]